MTQVTLLEWTGTMICLMAFSVCPIQKCGKLKHDSLEFQPSLKNGALKRPFTTEP